MPPFFISNLSDEFIFLSKNLDAVIGLPANLFYGTSIPTCVLVFKGREARKSKDILFIDASNEFEKGKKIEVNIPLAFVGVSPAVKDLGGNLVKVMHEITIEASPENLPHEIEVDISALTTFDSVILAKDITLPKGVSLATEEDEVVASVSAPRGDEPEEPAVAPDLSAIEVVKKGKKDEEADGAGE